MALAIRLENFEGPFDLLCHLLDENQVDIYDIPIAEITRQYLEYLDDMAELDLEIASEFLVLAATLIAIKTKMLLPVVRKGDDPAFPEGYYEEEEDPRSDLVRQILEYKKYRELAVSFTDMAEKRSRLMVRPNEEEMYVSLLHENDIYRGFSLDKLSNAMNEVITRIDRRDIIHRVKKENITIDDQIRLIDHRLAASPEGIRFASLYEEEQDRIRIIVLFLALLEMIRRQRIVVLQKINYGDIMIFPAESVKKL
ncbi:MAG: segregation/condensation protein A [Firmicutes bacterium]|nr:segregation/condensation protein A [Bacillota bacterium]